MWTRRLVDLLASALLASVAIGCDSSRPGAGFTNGPEPEYAPENPAVRTDLPPPEMPEPDIEPGMVSSNPEGGTGSEAGIGGRSGGQAGVEPAEVPSPSNDRPEVPATPPTLEGPAGYDAAGGTRPRDGIKVGNPKTPQS